MSKKEKCFSLRCEPILKKANWQFPCLSKTFSKCALGNVNINLFVLIALVAKIRAGRDPGQLA